MNRRLFMVDGRTLAGHPPNSQVNPTPSEFSRPTQYGCRYGETLQVLARNAVGETIIATLAIADNTLYVRTAGHIWAFGK